MKKIRTVTGDLHPLEFGHTLIHEHVILNLSHIRRDPDAILEDADYLNQELSHLKQSGCGGIVEVTNHGMGRNVKSLQVLSTRHQIPIVASTGYYKQSYYPESVKTQSEEQIAERFISEIKDGIEDTGIRAGIIAEIGSSLNEITSDEEKVFRAAIRAQKETGAPLSTHCELGTMGTAQWKLFSKHHANFSKISIGHQDLSGNRHEYKELLRAGFYLQFDTIGKDNYRSDQERLLDFLYLLDQGFIKQLMLSCDITKQSYLKVNGGFGYEHLFTDFIPKLRNHGVSQAEIDILLQENPRRFLAFV